MLGFCRHGKKSVLDGSHKMHQHGWSKKKKQIKNKQTNKKRGKGMSYEIYQLQSDK